MKILKIFKKPVFLITLVLLAAVLSISVVAAEAGTYGKVASYEVGMQGSVYLKLNVDKGSMADTDFFEVVVDGKDAEQYPVGQITGNKILVKLAPAEMNKTVTVTPVMGGTRGTAQMFKVVDYANAVLENPEYATTFHDPMRTLLNWGAKSEAFFGKGTTISIGDVFTRGSDPSKAVEKQNIKYTQASGKVETGVFEDAKHKDISDELNLILGEGNISLCFKFAASENAGTLKANISRGGVTITNDDAEVYYSGGYYTVKINGITTSLFDDVYTVTVSDDTEDNKIIAQASVLEYLYKILNNESKNTTKSAEQKATAQALFQFYQATVADAYPAECNHQQLRDIDGGVKVVNLDYFWVSTGEGNGTSYCRCPLCFKNISNAVPETATYYSAANLATRITWGYSTFSPTGFNPNDSTRTLMNEDGTYYTRFQGPDSKASCLIGWSKTKTENGDGGAREFKMNVGKAEYLVIKARSNTAGQYLRIILSTEAYSGVKAAVSVPFNVSGSNGANNWDVFVINLKDLHEAYKPNEDGNYVLDRFELQFWDFAATHTIDIEYMAFVEGGFSEINKLVAEESALKITSLNGSYVPNGSLRVNTADGRCLTHAISNVTTATVEGGTEYSYACTACDFKYTTTVPTDVNYYADLVTMKDLAGNNSAVFSKYMYDEANDVLFNRLTIPNAKANILYVTGQEFKNADLTNARYLVVKYRAIEGSKDQINFNVVKTQNGTTTQTLITDSDNVNLYTVGGSKWRVCVVDMKEKIKSSDSEIYIQALVVNHIDIAYVAITDTLAEVKELLTKQDYSGSDVMLREYNPSNGQPSHVRSVQGGKTVEEVLAD